MAATLQAGPYEEDKDFIKLEGDGEPFLLREGYFCILILQDAHMPGGRRAIRTGKEVVVKVEFNLAFPRWRLASGVRRVCRQRSMGLSTCKIGRGAGSESVADAVQIAPSREQLKY